MYSTDLYTQKVQKSCTTRKLIAKSIDFGTIILPVRWVKYIRRADEARSDFILFGAISITVEG